MSITTFGVDGYDYQYLSSLYLILRFQSDFPDSSFFIEKLNAEDMTARLQTGEIFEFQFKKRINSFDLEEFASCLAKFDPRGAEATVLSKILNGQVSRFIIITDAQSEAFVLDSGMLAKQDHLTNYPSKSGLNHIPEIIISLKSVYKTSKTKLGIKRHKFMMDKADDLTGKSNKNILAEKVMVIDRLTNTALSQYISSQFNKWNIPFSQHQNAIDDLIRIIKQNRSNDVSVFPLISDKLKEYAITLPHPSKNYIPTGREAKLYKELTSSRILCLTGATMCGKTQTALYLARKLLKARQGMAYLATSNLFQAENFLLANVSEDRLVFLDDPFGQDYNDRSAAVSNQLRSILEHIQHRPNRFLIITANDSVTQKLVPYVNLPVWKNLTIGDRDLLKTYWARIENTAEKDYDFFTKMLFQLLESDPEDKLLQFGQLDHLHTIKDNISHVTEQSIRHAGNFGTSDIHQEMLNMPVQCQDVLACLAISCSGTSGVSTTDLQYLFDSDPAYLPGINEKDNSLGTFVIGRGNKDEQHLAEYRSLAPLDQATKDILQNLSAKGYLLAQSDGIRFKHPIYEEAARRFLNAKNNIFQFEKIKSYSSKIIGSLNERLVLNALKNLDIALEYLKDESSSSRELLQIISAGLKSTFVNVRDHTQILLGAHYRNLSDELSETLENRIRNRGYHSNDYYWSGDIPYIPSTPHSSIRSGIFDRLIMRTAGAKKWKKLFNAAIHLSPKDADLALENLISRTENQPFRISYPVNSLLPLLRYNEIFIREQAAYLIAASLDDASFESNRIFLLEDKPLIKFQILRGLFKAWPYFLDTQVKENVITMMDRFLKDPYVSLLAVDFFTQFKADYGPSSFKWRSEIEKHAIQPMWHLWASLTPGLVSALPVGVHIHAPRFYTTLTEGKAENNDTAKVITAWLDWLLRYLQQDSVWLKEIEITILNAFHINFAFLDLSIRIQKILDLFRVKKIFLHCYLLRLLLANWKILDEQERKIVVGQVKNEPELIPIALTAENLPLEVQKVLPLFPGQTTFSGFKDLNEPLLMQVLVQLYIYPPTTELRWAGYTVWNKILRSAISKPDILAFRVAFSVFFQHKMGWEVTGTIKWPAGNIIEKALTSNPDIHEFIFDVLLQDLLENNGSESKRQWKQFFDAIKPVQQINYGAELLNHIEGIDNYDENLNCIPDAIFSTAIAPYINADMLVYETIKFSAPFRLDQEMALFMEKILESDHLRLKATILRIRNWSDKHPEVSVNLKLKIGKALEQYFEKARIQRESHQRKMETYFNQWFPGWAQ